MAGIERDDERLFTASEVQAAIAAVILYERALAERRMRAAAASPMAAIDVNRREIRTDRYMTIDEIRKGLG